MGKRVAKPHIWLQDNEDFGEADCGCILERTGSGPRAIFCPMHDAAAKTLEALKTARKAIGNMTMEEVDKPLTNGRVLALIQAADVAKTAIAKADR